MKLSQHKISKVLKAQKPKRTSKVAGEVSGHMKLTCYAVKALKNRKACLLANHGVIITGKDIDEAAFLAEELETLCKQITIAKINGTAKLVGKKDMKKIIEAVKTYGKQ